MRKKRTLILDPDEDPIALQLMNDITNDGLAVYDYNNEKKQKWVKVSSKIGRKADKLIKDKPPFLYPPSTSRTNQLGFINKPKGIDVSKENFGSKIKFIFQRKIF